MGKGKRLRQKKKIAPVEIPKSNRLKYILATSIAATIITIPTILNINKNEEPSRLESITMSIDLNSAKQNPSQRQAYLDNLLANTEMPYCDGVVYDHTGEKMIDYLKETLSQYEFNPEVLESVIQPHKNLVKDGMFYAKAPEIFDLGGKGKKLKIFVGQKVFLDYLPDSDIKQMIAKHEHRHTEQHARGLKNLGYMSNEKIIEGLHNGLIQYEVLYALTEVDAIKHELKTADSSVSSAYINKTRNELNNYQIQLKKALNTSSELQKELIALFL